MTPTAAARPSPASMPMRKASPADRALIAPGTPPPGMAFRAVYERAILSASRLRPHDRFVAIALATHADVAGQVIQQPRLVGLIHDTGLHAGQVVVALNSLKQRGWIRQAQPSAPYDSADLLLTIPAPILARLRSTTTARVGSNTSGPSA
ncbi:hypothetical protein [Streptomyces sp. NPDC001876]|uniref:hypothetical protein n=1 Tax=Streptomyces sp. NPDC001876 TaxID=3154402 RepID=UPI0033260A75